MHCLVEKQSNLNTFLQGTTTDLGGWKPLRALSSIPISPFTMFVCFNISLLPSIASTDRVRVKVNTGSTKVKDFLLQYLSYFESMNTCPLFFVLILSFVL